MQATIKHICLADDDPDDYYLFSRTLREVNDTVAFTWCNTCDKLLQFLRTHSPQPDLILLDWNMPITDGATCLRKIKEEAALRHIPVIIFSTASTPGAIETAIESGALKYMVKPFSIAGLKEVIIEILKTPMK
jgi:Response regulators consisting of a CheY-like receiver domain and a winged-helix DNA-binding domain